MPRVKVIAIPDDISVDDIQIDKLNAAQLTQYTLMCDWDVAIANRYAYFVTHPDYLAAWQVSKIKQSVSNLRKRKVG
jgi:hypothetical protein